jgi:guanylate kinase
MPATLDELEGRLRGRGTDSDEEIARRMQVAVTEIEQQVHYDHIILSGSRDEDYQALLGIYRRLNT